MANFVIDSGNKEFITRVLKFEIFNKKFNASNKLITNEYQYKIPKELINIAGDLDELLAKQHNIKTFYIIKHGQVGFELKKNGEYFFFSIGYTDEDGNTDAKGIYLVEHLTK